MFEKYLATKKDFEAVEQGIDFVWRKELDFIFKDRSLIKEATVISCDSKFIYLWSKFLLTILEQIKCNLKDYYAYRIPHSFKIHDKEQQGWRAGVEEKVWNVLPKKIKKFPTLSGGLLTPFIKIQKKKKWPLNPYTTYESYLATIVHEFGHIYYNQYRNKKAKNSKLLNTALNLCQRKKVGLNINLYSFLPHATEVFAFCVDYTAASIFWPSHKKDIEKNNIKWINEIINKKDNIRIEWDSHAFAAVAGKIILTKYPQDWPDRILENRI